jgi:hypothetical protein
VLGRTYRFETRSRNLIGYSDFSEESYIAYGDVPSTPASPTLVSSTTTSISVKWTLPTVTDLDVTGYVLNMDNGKNGNFNQVYIGSNRPDITSYTVGDLTTGLPYRFTVQAINDNGYSA